MTDRSLLFPLIGALLGLALGYFAGGAGRAQQEVATLLGEVRLQNRTLDTLLAEQESALSASLAQCQGIQSNLESKLEACLFDTAERDRAVSRGEAPESAPRQLRGTDTYTETREYPGVPDDEK